MSDNEKDENPISVLFSQDKESMQNWRKTIRNGNIKQINDPDIGSKVIEITGDNMSQTFITAPGEATKHLGIKNPNIVFIVKNQKKYFTFEVQILDDKNIRRRFRSSTFVSATRVKPFVSTMPLKLDEGWNLVQFNQQFFVNKAYQTNYVETLRLQITSNCRIRRVFFSKDHLSEIPMSYTNYHQDLFNSKAKEQHLDNSIDNIPKTANKNYQDTSDKICSDVSDKENDHEPLEKNNNSQKFGKGELAQAEELPYKDELIGDSVPPENLPTYKDLILPTFENENFVEEQKNRLKKMEEGVKASQEIDKGMLENQEPLTNPKALIISESLVDQEPTEGPTDRFEDDDDDFNNAENELISNDNNEGTLADHVTEQEVQENYNNESFEKRENEESELKADEE